ncbi:MAG TPA: glycosyltransferase family 39 protein [Gemmatimonadales bacterium]|nr:glycosyltransferase family 39 protein [Gemmatimonadales bacterium]
MDVLNPAAAATATGAAATAERRWLLPLLAIAVAVRVATLGAYVLSDNTEARYAEIARKMVETGDWITPQFHYGVPFWSKPPLAMWLTSVSYLALGVGEFSARLPSLLACLAVLWLTYRLAATYGGVTSGLRAALVLMTTLLFFVSAGAVMTDPALVLGTTLSMAGFWNAMRGTDRAARLWGYAFFAGLAVSLLAKGLVGVVLTLGPVGVWVLWKSNVRTAWERLPWIAGCLLTAAAAVPWYLAAEARTPGFLEYFFVGEHWKRYIDSGWTGDRFGSAHARPHGTIWLFALAATLPWWPAWLVVRWHSRRAAGRQAAAADADWRAYLCLWMLAPPVFFTFAGNILLTYVLPGLPAFALLAAEAWKAAGPGPRWDAMLKLSSLWVPIGFVVALPFAGAWLETMHSARPLVAAYMAARGSGSERLYYLGKTPLSAEFYARGRVSNAATPTELDRVLAERRGDFYALTEEQLSAQPELRALLKPLGRYGRYMLLHDPRGAAARAS